LKSARGSASITQTGSPAAAALLLFEQGAAFPLAFAASFFYLFVKFPRGLFRFFVRERLVVFRDQLLVGPAAEDQYVEGLRFGFGQPALPIEAAQFGTFDEGIVAGTLEVRAVLLK
jgi:hypothetical protein